MPVGASRPANPPDVSAVADRFGLGGVVGEPVLSARGELGRIWRLETVRGRWAVKEVFDPSPTASDDALADAAFQERAIAGGIPMPRPVPATGGEVLVTLGEPDDRRSVRVYTWVDLAGRDARPALREVAAILGRLHALAPPDPRPVQPWFRVPPDPGELERVLARARAARPPWLEHLERAVPVALATTSALPHPARAERATVTCHLDFNPENVLVDRSGRVCVVDWENAGPELVSQEMASAVAEFTRDTPAAATFLRSYLDAGGTGRLTDASAFAMTFVVQANLIATYARRALDDAADPEDRRRAAHWVADIATNLFTLEAVEGWLLAARTVGAAGEAPTAG